MWGLTDDQRPHLLLQRRAGRRVTRRSAITGLLGGETILGIDFRPATGALYGLGSTSRLYTIDTSPAGDAGRGRRSGAQRHGLRLRLQPHRRPHPRHQQRRPEPPAQSRHRRARRHRRHAGLRRPGRRAPRPTPTTSPARRRPRSTTSTRRPTCDPEPAQRRHAQHVGALGIEHRGRGFDISAADGTAFAVLTVGGATISVHDHPVDRRGAVRGGRRR